MHECGFRGQRRLEQAALIMGSRLTESGRWPSTKEDTFRLRRTLPLGGRISAIWIARSTLGPILVRSEMVVRGACVLPLTPNRNRSRSLKGAVGRAGLRSGQSQMVLLSVLLIIVSCSARP
jgi:hypothetical protein